MNKVLSQHKDKDTYRGPDQRRDPGLVLANGVIHKHGGCAERSWAVVTWCGLDSFHTEETKKSFRKIASTARKLIIDMMPLAQDHFEFAERSVTCLQCLVTETDPYDH